MKNKFYLQKRKNQMTKGTTAPSLEHGSPDQKAKTLTTTLWRLIIKFASVTLGMKNFARKSSEPQHKFNIVPSIWTLWANLLIYILVLLCMYIVA